MCVNLLETVGGLIHLSGKGFQGGFAWVSFRAGDLGTGTRLSEQDPRPPLSGGVFRAAQVTQYA